MVLEVGSLNHNALDTFGPWQCQSSRCDDGLTLSVLPELFAPLAATAKIDGRFQPRLYEKDTASNTRSSRAIPLVTPRSGSSCPADLPKKSIPAQQVGGSSASSTAHKFHQSISTPLSQFTFTQVIGPSCFTFAAPVGRPTTAKRYRSRTDVDGSNTAALSCKKRRLRLQLITSRLSQPFSLPATHIINRDGIASGDRRFMKMATVVDSSKRTPGFFGSVLRRAAVLNSVRLRIHHEAAEKGHAALAEAAGNAAVLHHGLQLVTGARFLSSSAIASTHDNQSQLTHSQLSLVAATNSQVLWRRASPPSPSALRAAETVTLRASTSPRLKPSRCPVFVPAQSGLDDTDDADVAFPTSEHESRYDSLDDPEHVYSDFGAIFGGPGDSTESEDEDQSYEEYLDELDGISWVAR